MSLYVNQQKSELLDSLETQVRFSQLVAVLVGGRGLGKSFLLEQLHARLKDEVAIASVDASMAMSDEQLDKTISLQLGLSWQESDTELAARITNAHSEKVLIMIDNAHLLSAVCLEFILKLNQSQLSEKASSLFILLAGENSLPVMINRTPTFTRHPEMCVVFEIEPIQQSETRAIIETFSHPNSQVLKELKSGSKLDYFWQLSKGNPAELNYHMSRWLDEHSPTQVVEVETTTQPKTVIKALVYSLLAILLSTMLVYQDEINSWISPAAIEQTVVSNDTPTNSEAELKGQEQAKDLKSKVLKDKSDESSLATQPALTEQFESELVAEQQQRESQLQQDDASIQQSIAQTKQTNADKSRKTKNDNIEIIENDSQLDNSVAVSNSTANEKPTSQISKLTTDELDLLKNKASNFLLQWAGVSSRDAADKYRESHLAKAEMKIYRRYNNGKTLYIIVSNEFSNRALAEFALNDYLQQGIKEKPWIKSAALVQKEIKQFEASLN